MKAPRLLMLSFALAAGAWTLAARAAESPVTQFAGTGPILDAGIRNAPAAARPEIFWDWTHDMVSREGITHDLEAMKRIGLGGALIMLVGGVDISGTSGALKIEALYAPPSPVKRPQQSSDQK